MKFDFDGPNKIINVLSPVVDFDAKELYSEWKRWVIADVQNSKYMQAMKSIGGEPITDTVTISPYIEVLNGWRIKPYDGDYRLLVHGNIFATGGINPFISSDNGNVIVTVEVTSNSLTTTGDSDDIQMKLDTIISTLQLESDKRERKGFV